MYDYPLKIDQEDPSVNLGRFETSHLGATIVPRLPGLAPVAIHQSS